MYTRQFSACSYSSYCMPLAKDFESLHVLPFFSETFDQAHLNGILRCYLDSDNDWVPYMYMNICLGIHVYCYSKNDGNCIDRYCVIIQQLWVLLNNRNVRSRACSLLQWHSVGHWDLQVTLLYASPLAFRESGSISTSTSPPHPQIVERRGLVCGRSQPHPLLPLHSSP